MKPMKWFCVVYRWKASEKMVFRQGWTAYYACRAAAVEMGCSEQELSATQCAGPIWRENFGEAGP